MKKKVTNERDDCFNLHVMHMILYLYISIKYTLCNSTEKVWKKIHQFVIVVTSEEEEAI